MNPILYFLSPTLYLAHRLKESQSRQGNKAARATIIKKLNWVYFSLSAFSVVILLVDFRNAIPIYLVIVWFYFLLSRCNEIFIAFLKDAYDKAGPEDKSLSELSYRDRLGLSFRSYFELIFNFAIFHFLLPIDFWGKKAPSTILESVYFSGVTIATLGYGDITPSHWVPQLLSVYEVFCGFVLIIVCFAVYVGKAQNRNATNA